MRGAISAFDFQLRPLVSRSTATASLKGEAAAENCPMLTAAASTASRLARTALSRDSRSFRITL